MDKATAGQELRSEVQRGFQFLLQIAGSGSVFSYSPCFASLAPAAINAFAAGVSVAANLINITPEGVNIQPQGLDNGAFHETGHAFICTASQRGACKAC